MRDFPPINPESLVGWSFRSRPNSPNGGAWHKSKNDIDVRVTAIGEKQNPVKIASTTVDGVTEWKVASARKFVISLLHHQPHEWIVIAVTNSLETAMHEAQQILDSGTHHE